MNKVRIFLLGKTNEGKIAGTSKTDSWADPQVKNLEEKLEFDVEFLFPVTQNMSGITDRRELVRNEFENILTSHMVLADLDGRKGLGVGVVMKFAKQHNVPVYSICRPDSDYRNARIFYGDDWIHAYVDEFSDSVFDTVDDFITEINQMFIDGRVRSREFSQEQLIRSLEDLRSFDSGYDEGYMNSELFWGTEPAGLVKLAVHELLSDLQPGSTANCIDLGCGHGKNAIYLSQQGFKVKGVDSSIHAIREARKLNAQVNWEVNDMRKIWLQPHMYNIAVMTGSLHCLSNQNQISALVPMVKNSTVKGGYNVLSAFNDTRKHDLSGHSKDFRPLLLPHKKYLELYSDWEIISESDCELNDIHKHNNIPHKHSITRILARKPLDI